VFVFVGLHTTASGIGNINYTLELGSKSERPLYVGFANGVAGLVLFAAPVAGAIVDWLGFVPLFIFALGCGLVAVALSVTLQEPRMMTIDAVKGA
jgi:hypothetical protein